MEEKKQIKEINQHISNALQQWADIMLLADADNWSYQLNYSDKDALNAVFIVNHVLENVAIKSGYIKDCIDAHEKGSKFRMALIDFCGIDMHELVEKVLNEKENGNKS